MRSAPKIQRWIDVIAALLAHRLPVTFEALAQHVPAYLADGSVTAGTPSGAVKRMFERDKKELRALGVPLVTVGEEGHDDTAYRLSADDFYLPYLSVATARGRSVPRKVERYGYRALSSLAFEPDELAAVADAAARVRQLGDPALVREASSAIRKLAFDLPMNDEGIDAPHVVPPRTKASAAVLDVLGDALLRRKRVAFDYRAMNRDQRSRRTVEPYGLFFLGAHWYLAGRDLGGNTVRNFRVSRIAAAKCLDGREATPDFAIPSEFRLREHAASRQAWELGDGDAIGATVAFTGQSGATMAAASLGTAVSGAPGLRQFSVRRLDAFARWLLSFAGEARPVSPPALVAEYGRMIERTRAGYARTSRS